MTVTNNSLFLATDTGAVSGAIGRCSGTAGDGVALLNMILRNGYNWQQVTPANLTRSGTTATLSLTAHGFRNLVGQLAVPQRLFLLGSDDAASAFNSDALYYTWVSANSITYTVPNTGATTSAATGSSTLNGAIASTTATSLTVTANASFPQSAAFFCKVDSEVMLVTAGWATNTWTVRRGVCGTTAATHSNAAAITNVIYVGVAPAGGIITPWKNAADLGFSAVSNKDCFRAPAGNRFYIDVDDTTTTYMRLRFYEAMTAIATGTGQFPTTAQLAVDANGICCSKSNAANTTANKWVALCTDRMVFLTTSNDQGSFSLSTGSTGHFYFGDLINLAKSGDAYATIVSGGSTTGTDQNWPAVSSASGVLGTYMPRSYTQLGSSIASGRLALDARVGTSMGGGPMAFPYPMDGGIYLSPLIAGESSALPYRGTWPGVWMHGHSGTVGNQYDTFAGTGQFAGKTFMVQFTYSGRSFLLEVSNTIQST